MRVRTRVLVVLMMISALLAATPEVGAQGSDAPVDAPAESSETNPDTDDGYVPLSDADVEELIETSEVYWAGFRRIYGFDTDIKTMARIARDAENRGALEESGVPLTAEELVEVRARAQLGLESAEMAVELRARADFGGMFIDNEAGGLLRMTFTRSLDQSEIDGLRSRFSSPERVTFEVVRHSFEELSRAKDVIKSNKAEGSPIYSVGISEKENAVVVRIDDGGDSEVREPLTAEVAEDLRRLVGDLDTVIDFLPRPQLDACPGRYNCGSGSTDLRGGLNLDDDLPGLQGCTSGFVFVDPVNDFYHLSTSGHCDDTSNVILTISQQVSSNYITSTNAMQDDSGDWIDSSSTENAAGVAINGTSKADAVMVYMPDHKKSNDIFKWGAYKAWYINKEYADPGPTVGAMICVAGTVVLFKCGEVIDNSDDYTTGGTNQIPMEDHLIWEFEVDGNVTTYGGSSGSPVIGDQNFSDTKRRAVGLHHASGFECIENEPAPPFACIKTLVTQWVSKIHHVEALTGMDIVLADPN